MAGFAARAWSFAVPPESSITVTPSSGVGDATVTIDVHPNVANGTAAVAFTAPGTPPSQIAVRWATIEGVSKAPIGNLEAPAPDAGAGALTFGGWAMDDLGIKRVILVGVDVNGRERELAVTASFGVRPDLQQTFASWPGAGRGAWAVTLDPAATRDLALVRAEAEDVEGQRTTIGQRVLRASARETKSVALRIGAKGRPAA
jgi:hypothetical protein